jgi:RNA polymerase sigma-54 factor
MPMEMKPKLSPKLVQKLVLTPSLQQAIKLLQLSKLELQSTLQQEMDENPLLDEKPQEAVESEEQAQVASYKEEEEESDVTLKNPFDEIDIHSYFQDYQGYESHYSLSATAEIPPIENMAVKPTKLSDHLIWQLNLSNITSLQKKIAMDIIGNLDEDGYLKASIEEISQMGDYKPEDVQETLKIIQGFDPIGIGARDLKECLLIQLRYLGLGDTPTELIIKEYSELLESRQYKKLAKAIGCSLESLEHHLEIIKRLDPKPGSKYASDDTIYVVPDVFVVKVDDDYEVILNEDGLPRLRISPFYRRMLDRDANTSENVTQYIKDKLRSAIWLVKSYEQRQQSIYKVSRSIIKEQREFLEKGVNHIKPMTLSDIAINVGMHESTVSRIVTNKYMHTPQGIYEMKYFFHGGLNSRSGESISSLKVKNIIKKLIDTEDKTYPLSDEKIAVILRKDGLQIARRTVTKYREEFNIPSSKERKRILKS